MALLFHKAKQSLIRRLINSDEHAFKELIVQQFDRAVGYSIRPVKSRQKAESIARKAFLEVWDNRHSLDPEVNFDRHFINILSRLILEYLQEVAGDEKLQNELWKNIRKSTSEEEPVKEQDHDLRSVHNNKHQSKLLYKLTTEQR